MHDGLMLLLGAAGLFGAGLKFELPSLVIHTKSRKAPKACDIGKPVGDSQNNFPVSVALGIGLDNIEALIVTYTIGSLLNFIV